MQGWVVQKGPLYQNLAYLPEKIENFFSSFVEWWGPPWWWVGVWMPEGGRDLVLPLTYRDPLLQNLLQFLYLVYLYFIVLYFLFFRNLLSNPQFEHTIHPLVLYAFCLWGNTMYKIHWKYPTFQKSTTTSLVLYIVCLWGKRHVQNPLQVSSFSAKYISTGRIAGAGVLGQDGQILAWL